MTYTIRSNKVLLFNLLLLIQVTSCKKLVEVEPPSNKVLRETLYSNNQGAIGVLNQIYIELTTNIQYSSQLNVIPLSTGLAGDELVLNDFSNADYTAYYLNDVTPAMRTGLQSWTGTYLTLFKINDAIEGLSASTSLIPAVKTQLIGEAKFIRAFCYFYLVNLYGDVPIITSTDYKVTSSQARDSQSKVYLQIIEDLKEAELLLSDQFLDGSLLKESTEKLRPTKWAAKALLARVYLYNKNWNMAEQKASEVITNSTVFHLDSLNNVFLKNSKEAIWQTQPPTDNINTSNAVFFILPPTGPTFDQPTYLSENLLNSFEAGDQRKKSWVGNATDGNKIYYYPYKYKANQTIDIYTPLTEYYMILRLGEQYLIRAEARAEQNNLNGALSDLNIIRNRASLDGSTAKTKDEIINAIFHERQVELFVEWGDRWFDLIRRGNIDQIMNKVAVEKGSKWDNYKKYFPIPSDDILYNSNLKQTPGY